MIWIAAEGICSALIWYQIHILLEQISYEKDMFSDCTIFFLIQTVQHSLYCREHNSISFIDKDHCSKQMLNFKMLLLSTVFLFQCCQRKTLQNLHKLHVLFTK